MRPIFVRRGNVLFLLKSPADFFRRLQSGTIRSSDSLLVHDQEGARWLPIDEIREYQGATPSVGASLPSTTKKRSSEELLLDRFHSPGFNLRALLWGPFWLSQQGLHSSAMKGITSLIFILTVTWFGGGALGWSPLTRVLLLFGDWILFAGWLAFRTEVMLNEHQVQRFYQEQAHSATLQLESKKPVDRRNESPARWFALRKEQVLN